MTEEEKSLLELLKQKSLSWGKFTLASGASSNYYLDVSKTSMNSGGASLIGAVLRQRVREIEWDRLGGVAIGAVPLVVATLDVCRRLDGKSEDPEGFWVRSQAKDHGAGGLIGGHLEYGDRVVLLEDVITSGGSTLKAVDAIRQHGAHVIGVIALIDRLQGASRLLRDAGILHYDAVYTMHDFNAE